MVGDPWEVTEFSPSPKQELLAFAGLAMLALAVFAIAGLRTRQQLSFLLFGKARCA